MVLKILSEDDYNGLNDVLKAEYVKGEDDRYYPDVEADDSGWAFENVGNLRSTMAEERRRREKWEADYKALEKTLSGAKPEDIQSLPQLKRKIKEMENWTPDDKVQVRIDELKATYDEKLRRSQREFDTGGANSRRADQAARYEDQRLQGCWPS